MKILDDKSLQSVLTDCYMSDRYTAMIVFKTRRRYDEFMRAFYEMYVQHQIPGLNCADHRINKSAIRFNNGNRIDIRYVNEIPWHAMYDEILYDYEFHTNDMEIYNPLETMSQPRIELPVENEKEFWLAQNMNTGCSFDNNGEELVEFLDSFKINS